MRTTYRTLLTAATLIAAPLAAQSDTPGGGAAPADTTPQASEELSNVRQSGLMHYRPVDRRGINVFEPPKDDGVPYTGFKFSMGGAFTQQLQGLDHETDSDQTIAANRLVDIGSGFNTATANLYLGAQLADGIRVEMVSYLSSRHHNETWVKDGYLLIDDLPIQSALVDDVFKYLTLRMGHFEVNYGDFHFRRSDNGHTLYNPFVGNLIMDAFTTEIGGEAYFRTGPWMAMFGMTGGQIRGTVTAPGDRTPAFLTKLGYDQQLTDDVRVRLTASRYSNDQSPSNTLFAGDRAGSRYYWVMENSVSTTTESSAFRSGMINPGFSRSVTTYQVNPFVKVGGLELFGVGEWAEGKQNATAETRSMTQYMAEGLYRLFDDNLYVGARWNTVSGELAGITNDISVDRWNFGGGLFLTPSVLIKAEYVTQQYNDFPVSDIRHGGKFNGFMIEGAVAF